MSNQSITDDQNALALSEAIPGILQEQDWRPHEAQLKQFYAPKATTLEWQAFVTEAIASDLDPRRREIMCVSFGKIKVGNNYVEQYQPYIGLAGVRKLAERTGRIESREGPFWCGEDGIWQDKWIDMTKGPVAATFRVWTLNPRTGHVSTRPTTDVVTMKRARTYTDNGVKKLMGLWASDPAFMLGKCAEIGCYKRAGLFADVPLDIDRGFAEEFDGVQIVERDNNTRPPALSANKHLHLATGKRVRTDVHTAARQAVNTIDENITSLADADPEIMDHTADFIEVLDTDGVADLTGVAPEDVQGEPAEVAPAAPEDVVADDESIRPETKGWLDSVAGVLDYTKLGNDDATTFVNRAMLTESKARELCKRVAACIDPVRFKTAEKDVTDQPPLI